MSDSSTSGTPRWTHIAPLVVVLVLAGVAVVLNWPFGEERSEVDYLRSGLADRTSPVLGDLFVDDVTRAGSVKGLTYAWPPLQRLVRGHEQGRVSDERLMSRTQHSLDSLMALEAEASQSADWIDDFELRLATVALVGRYTAQREALFAHATAVALADPRAVARTRAALEAAFARTAATSEEFAQIRRDTPADSGLTN